MGDWIALDIESLRLAVFGSVCVVLLLWQYLMPKRVLPPGRWHTQGSNVLMVALGNAAIRILFPAGLVVFASTSDASFGLLPWLGMTGIAMMVVGVILLDCTIYWQHRLFHKVGLLWRLHRVHHCDEAIELTTALRFHPVELVLSFGIKIAAVWLLGIDALSIVVFEILLSSSALFNHSNIALPQKWDRVLRWFLVTPDMHRVHHSQLVHEHNSNYGFCFSLWDRLFLSYTAEPQLGHKQMHIGLPRLPGGGLVYLLALPFHVLNKSKKLRSDSVR